MILNINKCASQKQSQANLLSTQNFLQKNKITVNEVSQSHYTVEGVQAYSPQQIKALKQTQQRKKQIKGTPIQVKTYQVAGYFDDFQETKQLTPKQKVSQALKNKQKLDVKNGLESDTKMQFKQKVKITNRDKMMKNNNVIVKLQKERNKKSAIQQKLSKLSKQYKQYFKGSKNDDQQNNEQSNTGQHQQDEQEEEIVTTNKKGSTQKKSVMYESLKKIIKSKDEDDQSQEEPAEEAVTKNSKSHNISFKKNNQKAFSVASTYATKSFKQEKKPANKPKAKPEAQLEQQEQDLSEQAKSKGQLEELEDRLDSISQIGKKNKSTYSQKLGSAVHLLFM